MKLSIDKVVILTLGLTIICSTCLVSPSWVKFWLWAMLIVSLYLGLSRRSSVSLLVSTSVCSNQFAIYQYGLITMTLSICLSYKPDISSFLWYSEIDHIQIEFKFGLTISYIWSTWSFLKLVTMECRSVPASYDSLYRLWVSLVTLFCTGRTGLSVQNVHYFRIRSWCLTFRYVV